MRQLHASHFHSRTEDSRADAILRSDLHPSIAGCKQRGRVDQRGLTCYPALNPLYQVLTVHPPPVKRDPSPVQLLQQFLALLIDNQYFVEFDDHRRTVPVLEHVSTALV
jgi:hypothetical protein